MSTTEKKQVKVSDVLALLKEGKDRKQIRQELDLNPAQASALFKHPSLKGKRVMKGVENLEIIDDTTTESGTEQETAAPSQENPATESNGTFL